MEWIKRMNAAMEYLEAHLTDGIDVSEIARIARCSSFHFQRMFSYMAGVPLGEYVRRRRMTRAAEDLCNGGARHRRGRPLWLRFAHGLQPRLSERSWRRAFQGARGDASGVHARPFFP